MSIDPGSLNPVARRSLVPGWWDPGIRTNIGAGYKVLAKYTLSVLLHRFLKIVFIPLTGILCQREAV